ERVGPVAFEAAERGVELEQAMDRLRFASGRLGEPLRRPARRRAEVAAQPLSAEELENASHQSRLTRPRAAGDDEHLAHGRLAEGVALTGRELEAHRPFDALHGPVEVEALERMYAGGEVAYGARDAQLGEKEWLEIEPRLAAVRLAHELVLAPAR